MTEENKTVRGSGRRDPKGQKTEDLQKAKDMERWLQFMKGLMNMNRKGLV